MDILLALPNAILNSKKLAKIVETKGFNYYFWNVKTRSMNMLVPLKHVENSTR
jgi:hypothetical protein